MSLRLRLALLFSFSVFFILLISSFSIYYLNENFRKEEYNKRLILKANESNRIFISDTSLSQQTRDELNGNAEKALVEEHLFVIDTFYQLLHKNPGAILPKVDRKLFLEALHHKIAAFQVNNQREGIILFENRFKPHFIVVTATDIFGYRKSKNLKVLLIASVIGGLLLSGLLAFIYVQQALRPLEDLKKQIQRITEANLKDRIIIKGENEVSQIGKQFNDMLIRLEQAFEHRKSFVQHASHELRTPLAIMLSQTEAALSKPLSNEEYREVLISLQDDQQNLIDLINSLLTLSRYHHEFRIKESELIRVDELLFECAEFVSQAYKNPLIAINFATMPENENELIIKGNQSLIKSAFQNLIKNALQYSNDNAVKISIVSNEKYIKIIFENNGQILTKSEVSKLFIPFFRGENAMTKKGYGLGLSIVEAIVRIHNGTIEYVSEFPSLNKFVLTFYANNNSDNS